MFIPDPDPDLIYLPIPDPDPQHCWICKNDAYLKHGFYSFKALLIEVTVPYIISDGFTLKVGFKLF
jgi:hypothetical protein